MPFKPGQSGNPGGKAKGHLSQLRADLAKHLPAFTREVVRLATSAAKESDRLKALEIALGYLCGKPTQPISGDEERPPMQVLITGPAPLSPADWAAKHADKE